MAEEESPSDTPKEEMVVNSMFANAASATDKEHKMGLWQGIRLYHKAILWAGIISLSCAMEGYDIALIGNFYAFPPFNRKYGKLQPDGNNQVPARWQAGISNGAQYGQIIGLLITGYGVEKIGFRPLILRVLFYQTAVTTTFSVAPSIKFLLLVECLAGIAFSVFMSRIGQLIAIGVIESMFGREDKWAYRIPCGLQWMWFHPLIAGIFLAPESPWWLVRKERYDKAKKLLLRLTSPKTDPTFDADGILYMMRHTNELEKDLSEGAAYLDCFKGVNLRRTEIVCMLLVSQTLQATLSRITQHTSSNKLD